LKLGAVSFPRSQTARHSPTEPGARPSSSASPLTARVNAHTPSASPLRAMAKYTSHLRIREFLIPPGKCSRLRSQGSGSTENGTDAGASRRQSSRLSYPRDGPAWSSSFLPQFATNREAFSRLVSAIGKTSSGRNLLKDSRRNWPREAPAWGKSEVERASAWIRPRRRSPLS